MNSITRSAISAGLILLVSACSTTGGGQWSSDWKNCMAAGAMIGGGVAATSDNDAADGHEGAAVGAVVGALVCALVRKDEDGDGVVDDEDRCPGTPEGVAVDDNGCELDDDGDGVVNRLDRCPASDPGVRVDAAGCELDSDGDGVRDSKDQCPGTPAGAPVDAAGCELDSDGDGVKDSVDQCPDTAEGQAVDNRGCDLPVTYELRGVYFEFDSAALLPASQAAIDEAISIMSRHQDLHIEIAGHTDSRGTDAYNQELSERRANAVKNALVKGGIDASRLSVKGYGEAQPVADNDSDEGRAKNRRVELHQH